MNVSSKTSPRDPHRTNQRGRMTVNYVLRVLRDTFVCRVRFVSLELCASTFQRWWFDIAFFILFDKSQDSIGGYTFLIYLFCLMAATFFLFRNLPETKNRTFEQIAANFTKPQHEKSSLVCSSFNQADCNDADSLARDNGGVVKETDIDTVTLVTTWSCGSTFI